MRSECPTSPLSGVGSQVSQQLAVIAEERGGSAAADGTGQLAVATSGSGQVVVAPKGRERSQQELVAAQRQAREDVARMREYLAAVRALPGSFIMFFWSS